MSSPAASEQNFDKDNVRRADGQRENIAPKFCRECNNMLYPKEDKVNLVLMYQCRTCNYVEPAQGHCVYRNQLSSSAGETAGVTTDVGSDPTLPRSNKQCPQCSESEAVFFQSQQRTEETKMRLFFVCCACGHIFD